MDLFVAAILLKHPTQGQRVVAEYELAEKMTDASSAILKRVQVDDWEAFEVDMRKADDLSVKETAAYRARTHTEPFLEESDEYLGCGRGAELLDTSMTTFFMLLNEFRIESAGVTSRGMLLYRKSDLERIKSAYIL